MNFIFLFSTREEIKECTASWHTHSSSITEQEEELEDYAQLTNAKHEISVAI